MDLFEAINTRHSVRKFKPDIPPHEDIEKIIKAAGLAPSSTNAQMWHYIVIYDTDVKNEMKRIISDAYDEIMHWEEAKEKRETIEHYKAYSTFFTDAPVNIAVLMEPRISPIEELMRKRGLSEKEILRRRPNPNFLSVGASIENLSLAAHGLGYGTCWLTAPIQAYKEIEKILNVKKPFELVSLLCLGLPLNEKIPTIPKKELSEILTVIT